MRGFFASMFCTMALVGVAMQFERPNAGAVSLDTTTAPAAKPLTAEQRAAAAAELKSIKGSLDDIENRIGAPATVTPEPMQYELVKVCDGNRCHYERRPIANAAKKLAGVVRGDNCSCGCGCSNCNCGYQPVQQTQQADPVRRGLFGRRSGRLFGGRLFGGRLFGGRMGGCSSCGQ